MKNKNTIAKKAILDYMTWSSPMNQAFIIEALGRDNIEFTYAGGETNIIKVKQAIKLFGVERIQKALESYASAIWDKQDEVRESMKNSFISPDAWIRSAREALDIDLRAQEVAA
jgi:hypothetical protein